MNVSVATPTIVSYPSLIVPYHGPLTIAPLIVAGKYDYVNSDITDEYFPQEREGEVIVVPQTVHFDRDISTDDAIAEIKKLGKRSWNAAECLAFGAANPELQRQFPLTALGQFWQHPNGDRHVVHLGRHGNERHAHLDWIDDDWGRFCRFGVVDDK